MSTSQAITGKGIGEGAGARFGASATNSVVPGSVKSVTAACWPVSGAETLILAPEKGLRIEEGSQRMGG